MHEQILGTKGIDHRDGNTLNNCDYNLRPANPSQNAGNQRKQSGTVSQYKGVHFNHHNKKWYARIGVNSQRIYLGCFKDEEAAAWAYDTAALKYFGEFARLNFALGDSPPDCDDARQVALYLATKKDGPNGSREGPAKGEGHGMVKLTWEQVCLIRLGGLVGMSRRFLGEHFHIEPDHAGQILRGKNWKEPPETEEYIASMFEDAIA